MQAFPLRVWPGRWAVCRLPHDAAVPQWATSPARLLAVVRSESELSILAPAGRVPVDALAARDFRVIEVVGPVPFSAVGLMAAITAPLAAAGVSVFTVSTYDTDYVLVPDTSIETAVAALRGAGFSVE
jgi:hypothetical protein